MKTVEAQIRLAIVFIETILDSSNSTNYLDIESEKLAHSVSTMSIPVLANEIENLDRLIELTNEFRDILSTALYVKSSMANMTDKPIKIQ